MKAGTIYTDGNVERFVTYTGWNNTPFVVRRESGKWVEARSEPYTPTPTTKSRPVTFEDLREIRVACPKVDMAKMLVLGGFTLGSDPEIFVTSRGRVIPAPEFLPSKANATKTVNGHGEVFWDGFQAEWTTSPQSCLAYLVDDIRAGLSAVLTAARRSHPDAKLSIESVMKIPRTVMGRSAEETVQFGCSPSRNAYDEPRVVVDDPAKVMYRSAGWHMHYSMSNMPNGMTLTDDSPLLVPFIKLLDATIGLMMVSEGEGFNNPLRRTLYGRAGEYRFKRTLEYRPPDVAPMIAHPAYTHLNWEISRFVLRLAMLGLDGLWKADEDDVRAAMNEYDVRVARRILRANETVFKQVVNKIWLNTPAAATAAWHAVMGGIGEVVADPRDVEKNWKVPYANVGREYDFGHINTFAAAIKAIAEGKRL